MLCKRPSDYRKKTVPSPAKRFAKRIPRNWKSHLRVSGTALSCPEKNSAESWDPVKCLCFIKKQKKRGSLKFKALEKTIGQAVLNQNMNWRCLVGKTSFFIDFTIRYSQTHKEAHRMAFVHLRLNNHFQIQVWLRVCVEGVVHMLLHNAQQHQNMNESDLYLVTSILEPLEILWTCWNSIYPQQSMSFSRHARCQEIKREEELGSPGHHNFCVHWLLKSQTVPKVHLL